MPKCQFCGHENPAGVELCKGCSAEIPQQPDAPTPDEPSAGPPDSLEAKVLEELRTGSKISAIKLYREQTGKGLKDAKEAVEAIAGSHGVAPAKAGCAGVLLLILAAGPALVAVCW